MNFPLTHSYRMEVCFSKGVYRAADSLLIYRGVVYWKVSAEVLSANDACISRTSASARKVSQGVDRVSATCEGMVSGMKSVCVGMVMYFSFSNACHPEV